jgi:hypothetical protein
MSNENFGLVTDGDYAMRPRPFSLGVLFSCVALAGWAAEFKVQQLGEAPPKDGISPEIASQLAPSMVRVTGDGSAPYCDLWLCKSLPTVNGFQPTPELAYPFTPGQLIGVARFAKKSTDFRDQEIRPGVYTMRYAQQPVDGAHVGTSPTRDFLLLISAAQDKSPGDLDYKVLTKQSSEAAGSSHPAIFCMRSVPGETSTFPSIRHDEQHNWWIAALRGEGKAAGKTVPLPIGLVVVGVAAEQ